MAIQLVDDGEDGLDARNKWNENAKELQKSIQYTLPNTFIDTSTSNTAHTFTIENILSYEDIENKLISFIVTQATGNSHTFNINNYGARSVMTFNTNGNQRALANGEVVAGKLIQAFYRNNTFFIVNSNPTVATTVQAQEGTDNSVFMTPSSTQSSINATSVNSKSNINNVVTSGNCTICSNMTKAVAATYGGANRTVILIGATG